MKAILVALVMFVTATADGEADPGAYTLIGAGLKSCGSWAADRRNQGTPAQMDEQWVLGFLSGVGWTGKYDPQNGMDAAGVWAWIDNYCQGHPIDNLGVAAAKFVGFHPR